MTEKTKQDPIKTILIINVGLLIVFFGTKWHWPVVASTIIGLLGLSSRYLSFKIDYLWMKLTWLLGMIMPNILLSVIFFFFLTPVALLAKVFGKSNPLFLKNLSSTLFKVVDKKFEKSSFEKTW